MILANKSLPLNCAVVKSEFISTIEAAQSLGVTAQQVRNLIASGALPAQKAARDFIIRRSDLAKVPKVRKRGPKPKAK